MYLFGDVIDKTPEPNPTPSGPVQIPTIGEQIGLTPPQPAPETGHESDCQCRFCRDDRQDAEPQPAPDQHEARWAEDWTAEQWHDIITKDPCKATSAARHLSIECGELKEDVANLRLQLKKERAELKNALNTARALDHAAQEQRRPCGECHLQPGEVCDICGKQEQPAPAGSAVEEQSAVEWVNNKTTQCQHVPKRVNVVRTNYALALAYRFDELSAKFAEVERKRDSDHRTMEWITKNWQAAEAVAEERRAMGAEYIRDLSEFRDKLAAAERCVERLRGALERISRMDAETVGLHPQFYGHGAAIARAALAETKEDHANG